ncbi:2-oxoglutarate-dependent dioxygenase tropC [Fulvia fulva]|uniref:2-oxoglutarate-dependent dioxygenase tropC n=1 Tax=Passalora fulva TaxID=5499 RepID=A0A9Q8L8U0_PASFU|nr:2-oxoglutarate-dependent dioxygenase tropC [Fulvia fulva]KAK4637715.1 2-oxoglutarate-dependent dioxygenase tropC [Fulvia fulva]UJO12308.1 2-oxoglutarate-dependent dioxygenase tropC [Fulvia fulva]WPV09561.1 2-oxoglutarate-dependent dioxygenase tropC [Fulvia fulva]
MIVRLTITEIPTINISPYLDPTSSPSAKAQVVAQVKEACTEYGFLQVKGHGIPLEPQRQILECCKTFFDLPIEQKEALSLKNSPSRHGYERIKEQVLDKTALPDDKEGFYIGAEETHEKGFRRGPNQWPPTIASQDFREPVTTYYTPMLHLARSLLEILVLGLDGDFAATNPFDPTDSGGETVEEHLRLEGRYWAELHNRYV